jgi:hypothetical protein
MRKYDISEAVFGTSLIYPNFSEASNEDSNIFMGSDQYSIPSVSVSLSMPLRFLFVRYKIHVINARLENFSDFLSFFRNFLYFLLI